MMELGVVLAQDPTAADAIETINSGITTSRSSGATVFLSFYSSVLAHAYAQIGQFDYSWRFISEATTAMEASKETWCEAEVYRTAGEIVLQMTEPDAAKAEDYFQRALAVARQQQTKSWELRAAMSLARLWRSQGRCSKRANCSLRFTDGSRKGATRAI